MTDYPSLSEQGKNLAQFTFDVMKKAMTSGALMVSNEVKEQRLAICRECDAYDESQVRCKQCGCFLDAKASFALDSCPLKKWEESDSDWNSNFDQFIDQLNEIPNPDVPQFPAVPELNQVYEWKDMKWIWNGQLWDIIEEK